MHIYCIHICIYIVYIYAYILCMYIHIYYICIFTLQFTNCLLSSLVYKVSLNHSLQKINVLVLKDYLLISLINNCSSFPNNRGKT